MKTIKEALQNLKNLEEQQEALCKFLGTKRGKMFVNSVSFYTLKDLYKRFEVPKRARVKSIHTVYNCLVNCGLATKAYHVGGFYTYSIKRDVTNEVKFDSNRQKYALFLTKKDHAKIERLKPKKLGSAAYLHRYEEHKMSRFEKKRKFPTGNDIFQTELDATINASREIYREYVRNFLSRVYCKKYNREYFYKVYGVYENKHNNTVYEREMTPSVVGYPFTPYKTEGNLERLKERLRATSRSVQKRDSECKEVKLYNKYGRLIASCSCTSAVNI